MSNLLLNAELQDWAIENEPGEEMLWKDGYWNQICFMRDDVRRIFFANDGFDYGIEHIRVISSHTSKSIELPVYRIDLIEKFGVTIILRNNFYDWKVSIISNKPIECDFKGLFDVNEDINYLYCEGFPREYVYGSYSKDNKCFTMEIGNNYRLYTFMWLLNEFLNS